jgi:Leucine-rich repeat (LRR) protein
MNKNIYENLIKLDLSRNYLTDLCFVPLIGLAQNAPKLSDLCLSNNKIKLQPLSSFKR